MTQEIDIGKYHQLALQKQKEHRKFLATLKKKAPKNLDKIVQEVHTEVFREIDCTKCANCCKVLGPLFTEADISRIAKHFRMRLPVFEDMYLRVDEDNDKVFKSMPCPFQERIISVLSMIFAPRPAVNFLIQIVKKFIKLTI